ncbi:complement factor H-related protein 2-like isoform 4-T4 [Molossus nigricans]
MLLLVSALLSGWVSWAHGQGKTCDFPEIQHGNIYEENRYKQTLAVATGTYFYYSCDHSFASPSHSLWTRINCTEEGWSPTPKCLRQCFFPWVENGHSTASGQTHQEGDTVQIVCDEGYSLPNNQSGIRCANSGWSTPPVCSPVYSERKCGPPPSVRHAAITTIPFETYAPGSSVEYQCQSNYELQGDRRITCRDGEWSEPPKCSDACVISEEIMKKHNLQFKWSSKKKNYSKTSDTVEFDCQAGYRRASPRALFRIRCREGKLTYPTCV